MHADAGSGTGCRAAGSAVLRVQGVSKALRVFLAPAKAAPEKHLVCALRDTCTRQVIVGQAHQVGLVAKHTKALDCARKAKGTQQDCTPDTQSTRQHQQLRCEDGQGRAGEGRECGVQLDRRAKQRLHRIRAHCESPLAVISTG